MRRYRDLGYRSADELLNTGWSADVARPRASAGARGCRCPGVVQIDHVHGVAQLDRDRRWSTTTCPRSDHLAVVAEVGLSAELAAPVVSARGRAGAARRPWG